jgi:hypothetical protein
MKCKYCDTEHPKEETANPHYCIARMGETIDKLSEALESIRATARAVMEAKDHELNIDPEWVIEKVGAVLGGKE